MNSIYSHPGKESTNPPIYAEVVMYVESLGYNFSDLGCWDKGLSFSSMAIYIGWRKEDVALMIVDPDCTESGAYFYTNDYKQAKAFVDNFHSVNLWVEEASAQLEHCKRQSTTFNT